jgi:hypothetical protein
MLYKILDLSKAVRHDHPDIIVGQLYLVKVHRSWFLGKFSRLWYGLNFNNWGTSGLQFDAPGYNSSRWEAVIELHPESLLNEIKEKANHSRSNRGQS